MVSPNTNGNPPENLNLSINNNRNSPVTPNLSSLLPTIVFTPKSNNSTQKISGNKKSAKTEKCNPSTQLPASFDTNPDKPPQLSTEVSKDNTYNNTCNNASKNNYNDAYNNICDDNDAYDYGDNKYKNACNNDGDNNITDMYNYNNNDAYNNNNANNCDDACNNDNTYGSGGKIDNNNAYLFLLLMPSLYTSWLLHGSLYALLFLFTLLLASLLYALL